MGNSLDAVRHGGKLTLHKVRLRIGTKSDNMNDYIIRHGLSAWKK